jgi:hypothetical protein
MTLLNLKHQMALMVALCTSTLLLGQSTPKYSNEFLAVGVGGQAFGMSNSVIASVNDVTAGYWNPAGLVHMKDNIQLSYMHTNYFAGIANYDYGGLAFKAGNNNVMGISFVRMGIDGIPNTLDLIRNGQIDYNRITEFSAVDYAFIFSYAQKTLKDGLSFGANAKIINRKAGQFAKAVGFGIDAGLQYHGENGWRLAVMARDVTSTFNAWKYTFTDAEKDVLTQTGNEIPKNSLEITLPKLILGVAKRVNFDQKFSMDAELNVDMNTDGRRNVPIQTDVVSFDPHLGIQWGYSDVVFLRGGIGSFQKVSDIEQKESWTFQPNIGVGVDLKKFAIDYAMADVADVAVTNYSHIFSIRFKINSEDSEN